MPDKKNILITGGSRGIGRAISRRCAADGYHVIINYRANDAEARETLRLIAEAGGAAELLKFDVTDKGAVAAAMEALLKERSLYGLVLCAGVRHDEALIFMTEEQWTSVLNVNLLSLFGVAKPVVKQMALNRAGRIVIISSTSGESGLPGQVNYAAAKAGIIGAMKAMALECAKRGVLVNAVTPGFIESDMTGNLDVKDLASRVPLKRFGKPEEVAGAVSFLCSGDATYITGQVIRVNGGIYM